MLPGWWMFTIAWEAVRSACDAMETSDGHVISSLPRTERQHSVPVVIDQLRYCPWPVRVVFIVLRVNHVKHVCCSVMSLSVSM